jgi:hypothetical protein
MQFLSTYFLSEPTKAIGIGGNSIPVSENIALASFPTQQKTLAGGSSIEAKILPLNGLGVAVTIVGTNATIGSVSNVVCNFALSGDGTNFATVAPGIFSVLIPPNGKTNQTVFTNLPVATVGNATKIRLVTVNNPDTNSTITVLALPISSTITK